MTTMRRFLSDTHGERGQSLVEFALVLPIVLLVITGVFDVARAVWQENTLAYAAREGTRYAIVHGDGYCSPSTCPDQDASGVAWPGNTTEVEQVVQKAAVGVGGNVQVRVRWPGPDGVWGTSDDTPWCYTRGCPVEVVATASFVPLPSYYMLGSAFQITLRGGSQLVIQR